MPFHIITGIPGHGKTSLLMELLVEAATLNAKHLASGKVQITVDGVGLVERPLYAAGIEGLQEGLANPLDDPSHWESLPDGSLVFVDECWNWFGHHDDARGAKPPKHVQGIATHRHKGLDFIGTCQSPKQLYPFLRPLVAPHWHVVRKFGTSLIDLYKWGELVEEVQSQGQRDRAVKEVRTIPSKDRDKFKSASAHTIKATIPKKLIVAVVAVLAAVPLLYFAVHSLRPESVAASVTGSRSASLLADAEPSNEGPQKKKKEPMTPEEYAAQFKPLIPGIHGSEPVFQDREVTAQPRTLCVISGPSIATRCRCWTEQATIIRDVQDKVCRDSAIHGAYDYFRQPAEVAERGAGDSPALTPFELEVLAQVEQPSEALASLVVPQPSL